MLFLVSLNCYSYVFTQDIKNGDFWQVFPIKFKIMVAESDERFEVTRNAFLAATQEWQNLTPIPLWDYIESKDLQNSATQNSIRWSDNFTQETGFDAANTMAITIRYSQPPLLQKTEIIINGAYHKSLMDLNNLKSVLMHELGHTLGLDHSLEYGSIMSKTLALGPWAQVTLSKDDDAALQAILQYHEQKQSEPLHYSSSAQASSSTGPMQCGEAMKFKSLNPVQNNSWNSSIRSTLLSMFIGFFPGIFLSVLIMFISKKNIFRRVRG